MSHMITLCQTVFQNRCTISHSYQQCMGIPISPLPGPKLLSCLLDSCCLVDMKWYLTVVLMCVFVVINEHLFMCFSLCISSLEKYFLDPLPSLKSVHLFIVHLQDFLVYSGYEPFIRYIFQIFSLILWIVFRFFKVFFKAEKFSILRKSILSVFLFHGLCF